MKTSDNSNKKTKIKCLLSKPQNKLTSSAKCVIISSQMTGKRRRYVKSADHI